MDEHFLDRQSYAFQDVLSVLIRHSGRAKKEIMREYGKELQKERQPKLTSQGIISEYLSSVSFPSPKQIKPLCRVFPHESELLFMAWKKSDSVRYALLAKHANPEKDIKFPDDEDWLFDLLSCEFREQLRDCRSAEYLINMLLGIKTRPLDPRPFGLYAFPNILSGIPRGKEPRAAFQVLHRLRGPKSLWTGFIALEPGASVIHRDETIGFEIGFVASGYGVMLTIQPGEDCVMASPLQQHSPIGYSSRSVHAIIATTRGETLTCFHVCSPHATRSAARYFNVLGHKPLPNQFAKLGPAMESLKERIRGPTEFVPSPESLIELFHHVEGVQIMSAQATHPHKSISFEELS